MKRYFQYLRKYKLQCWLGAFSKWIEAALELLVPLVMADIIDTGVTGGRGIPYVLWGGALMLGMGVVGYVCALFCQRSASIASQGFGTNVRNALFRHINTLSYRELDKIGAASLVTRTVNDVTQMQSAVAMIIRLVVPELNEERRKELTKLVRKGAEESKVAIRSIRRDAMEQFKKLEKDSLITEDDRSKAEKKMQETTDAAIKGIDELCAKKEKEIMEV